MAKFTIIPAIDLYQGKIVRLIQGDRKKMIQYTLSPVAAAQKWIEQGAKWLHVVNLDGAFNQNSKKNYEAIKRILTLVNGQAYVQFGGGLRNLAAIDHILSLGVTRVVLGTLAVEQPNLAKSALRTFGTSRIVLGVDAKDGMVRISGWEENADLSPIKLVNRFIKDGLEKVIYTNIRRDGMHTGVDVAGARLLANNFDIQVIASGGVAGLEDIKASKAAGLSGIIIGKALYEHRFSLSEGLAC